MKVRLQRAVPSLLRDALTSHVSVFEALRNPAGSIPVPEGTPAGQRTLAEVMNMKAFSSDA